jgi:hypothetical protein
LRRRFAHYSLAAFWDSSPPKEARTSARRS